MKATGLFFLRMRATTAVARDGRHVVVLPVVERTQEEDTGRWISMNELDAIWKGEEALAFFRLHQGDLVPGRGLDLEIDRLYGHDGAWRANVSALRLAPLPPSWLKHAAANTDQPPQALPA